VEIFLWKIIYKDAGDDMLAGLERQGDKVAFFGFPHRLPLRVSPQGPPVPPLLVLLVLTSVRLVASIFRR